MGQIFRIEICCTGFPRKLNRFLYFSNPYKIFILSHKAQNTHKSKRKLTREKQGKSVSMASKWQTNYFRYTINNCIFWIKFSLTYILNGHKWTLKIKSNFLISPAWKEGLRQLNKKKSFKRKIKYMNFHRNFLSISYNFLKILIYVNVKIFLRIK